MDQINDAIDNKSKDIKYSCNVSLGARILGILFVMNVLHIYLEAAAEIIDFANQQ